MFEAFKRGLYDFRTETEPLRWHEGYDFPAARGGDVILRAPSRSARRDRLNSWCSTPGGRNSPTPRCVRRWRCCSISNGSTTIYWHFEAILARRRLPPVPRPVGLATGNDRGAGDN